MLDAPPQGEQRPRLQVAPPSTYSAGADAIDIARAAGLDLDPWQEHVLEVGLARGADDRWAAFEVAVLVARQNGKGSILEALELWALFVEGVPLTLHSAHEFKTAKDAFRRVTGLIQRTPALADRVKAYPRNPSEFGVDLKSGERLRFIARSSGSGRGYTAGLVILDESFRLDGAAMAALLPTLSAVRDPQLWYASSAPMATSEQLHAVRRRALTALADGEPGRLAFMEWSAPDGADPEDWHAIAQANPALGIRIDAEFVEAERDAMPPPEFGRERMGIPDPESGAAVFPEGAWQACEEWPLTEQAGKLVFAVEVTPDRAAAAIVAAGMRPDGRILVEVVDARPGTAWILPRLADLSKRWRPNQLVMDAGSPAGALLRDLEDARIRPRILGTRDVVQACGAFYDGVIDRTAVHIGQSELSGAVMAARKRKVGDAWAWDRYNAGDATTLVAASLAYWAVSTRKTSRAVNLADALAAAED